MTGLSPKQFGKCDDENVSEGVSDKEIQCDESSRCGDKCKSDLAKEVDRLKEECRVLGNRVGYAVRACQQVRQVGFGGGFDPSWHHGYYGDYPSTGYQYVAESHQHLAPPRGIQWRHDPYGGGVVPVRSVGLDPVQAGIRQVAEGNVHADGDGGTPVGDVHQGSPGSGSPCSNPASQGDSSAVDEEVAPTTQSGRCGDGYVSLEGGRAVVGDGGAAKAKLCTLDSQRGHCVVGAGDKIHQDKSIHDIHVHGDKGPGDGANPQSGAADVRLGAVLEPVSGQDECHAQTNAGVRIHDPRVQARGCGGADGGSGAQRNHDGRRDASSETQASRDHTAVRGKSGGNGSSPTDSECDGEADMLKLWDEYEKTVQVEIDSEGTGVKHLHTFTRVRRTQRLATTKEDHEAPLHVTPVAGAISLERVRECLNEPARKRFDEVWNDLTAARTAQGCAGHKRLQNEDAQLLLKCGIVEPVDRANCIGSGIVPFTVMEEKESENGTLSMRRRFIAWTKGQNKYLEKKYVAQVPLKHVSAYIPQVHEEVALKRDLSCGFFQVGLPEECRSAFWFEDDAGKVWRMCVMPMGHVSTPEIMQVVMSVIAGDPVYCIPQKSCCVSTDVYIDGLRGAGSAARMSKLGKFVDERAAYVGAKFKDSESYCGRRYVWCGVEYDHEQHKVRLGPKTLAKLKNADLERITAAGLETLAARLLYASAVQGIHIPAYYMVLKFVRRRLNHMNRDILKPTDLVELPHACKFFMAHWISKAAGGHWYSPPLPKDMQLRQHTLFTDASAQGWGAVLVKNSGEVCVAGASWGNNTKEFEINAAEMRAVTLAIEAFKSHWKRNERVDLRVDNTSALHAVRKGTAKSQGVSKELLQTLEKGSQYGITFDAQYVKTDMNPADVVSRAKWDKSERAKNEEKIIKPIRILKKEMKSEVLEKVSLTV